MAVPFYHFQIRESNPDTHFFGDTSLDIVEGDLEAAQSGRYALSQNRRRFVIHRDPTSHPGTTMTLVMKFSTGSARGGFHVVAREATMDHATVPEMQAYTWNNPPERGVTALALQRFSRLPQVLNLDPNLGWTWVIPIAADAEDFLFQIEVQGLTPDDTGFSVDATAYVTDSTITFT